jgi:hypothetical protein
MTSAPVPAVRVFFLRVEGLEPRPHTGTLAHRVGKGECYLSPSTNIAEQGKAAHLVDLSLAESFAATSLTALRARHGAQVSLTIEDISTAPWGRNLPGLIARVRHDTSVVRARLRENNFAPNHPPLVLAVDLVADATLAQRIRPGLGNRFGG